MFRLARWIIRLIFSRLFSIDEWDSMTNETKNTITNMAEHSYIRTSQHMLDEVSKNGKNKKH